MYFPELVRGRERERKIQKEYEIEDRQKAEANKIIKWKCGKSKVLIGNIVYTADLEVNEEELSVDRLYKNCFEGK